MPEDKIESYELLGSLGRGGFSSVYKAMSIDGSLVAVKILNPQLHDNQKTVNMFFYEARVLSKLNHPNICKLIDFYPEGPDYIIVMEYIDGNNLKELMHNEPDNLLPFKQSLKIAKQCLKSFQLIYENGILHRDIKPSNIMVDKKGNSTIMDFGVAAVIGDTSYDKATKMLSLSYSAPERFIQTKKPDIRSDIYSLGMVFYELFTGRMPFDTNNSSQIKAWHLHEIPVPADTHNPSLSPKIVTAIKTALEKEPGNRFHDFLEFERAMGL